LVIKAVLLDEKDTILSSSSAFMLNFIFLNVLSPSSSVVLFAVHSKYTGLENKEADSIAIIINKRICVNLFYLLYHFYYHNHPCNSYPNFKEEELGFLEH
jgi:hypothetical protein